MAVYKNEDERKIIHAHSISGGMSNPSIQQQQAAGVELTARVTDPCDIAFEDMGIMIKLGVRYYDELAGVFVTPTKFYTNELGRMLMLLDGRSCTEVYAGNYWKEVV